MQLHMYGGPMRKMRSLGQVRQLRLICHLRKGEEGR